METFFHEKSGLAVNALAAWIRHSHDKAGRTYVHVRGVLGWSEAVHCYGIVDDFGNLVVAK